MAGRFLIVIIRALIHAALFGALGFFGTRPEAQSLLVVQGTNGVRVSVENPNGSPALRIRLPAESDADPGIFVLFPEHVTGRERGLTNARQLYVYRPDSTARPNWRRTGRALEYDLDVQPGLRLRARATLEENGVRYRYEFFNSSTTDYDLIQAVTDPRMVSPYFRDVRLERTYVHHEDGFDLIAAESPTRVNLPLSQWLPNRHRVPYSWPIDTQR